MSQVQKRWLKTFLYLTVLFAAVLVFFRFGSNNVLAQVQNLDETAEAAGLVALPLGVIIGRIISAVLGLLGVIFISLIIYAGFLWMTAAGATEKVEKAKKILIQAVIGLIIILASYAITAFIIGALTGQGLWSGGSGTYTGDDYDYTSVERLSGSLGTSIADHYPNRGAQDVSRNTMISVTFFDVMQIESFIEGYESDSSATQLNVNNIKIYDKELGPSSALESSEVSVSFSDNHKTFLFNPVPALGSDTEDTTYIVALAENIRNAENKVVLGTGGYEWWFTVGTEFDLDPPSIKRVTPAADGTYDKNIVVQITFDEPVNPISASGTNDPNDVFSNFENITITGSDGNILPGVYLPTNEYRTIVFRALEPCGINSCGETIYCLSGGDALDVNVQAATPGVEPPQVDIFPYNGIVDMAGNSFDGNNDGIAGDDYTWSFSTTNDTNLDAPQIVPPIIPYVGEPDVDLDQDIIVTFDSVMMRSTLDQKNMQVESNPVHEMWYRIVSDDINEQTQATIKHGIFLESNVLQTYQYGVSIKEGVRNEYQNCFSPAVGPDFATGICGTSAQDPFCCEGIPSATACQLF